jgi:hypothetical protein
MCIGGFHQTTGRCHKIIFLPRGETLSQLGEIQGGRSGFSTELFTNHISRY